MALVRVGHVGRSHGVGGELALDGCSLTVAELRATRRFVWSGRRGATRPVTLAAVRPVHARLLVRFDGVADRDAAVGLAGGVLWAEETDLPDPGPGTVYTFQLLGLAVELPDGRALGTLEDVLATGAHPVYVVRAPATADGPGREILVPAPPEFVKRVDLEAGTIVVDPPAGFDEVG